MKKKTGKRIPIIIAAVLMFFALTIATKAEAKPRIYFTGAPSKVLNGATFEVNVVVDGVVNLYGVEIEAIYSAPVIASDVSNNEKIQTVTDGAGLS